MKIKFRVSNPIGELVNFAVPKWVLKDKSRFDNETVGRAIARKNGWQLYDVYYVDDEISIVFFEHRGRQIGSCTIHLICDDE